MFLEDELNEAYAKMADNKIMVDILVSRLPDPNIVGVDGFLNEIKKVHFIWKKFCATHPQYNPEGFKRIMLSASKDNEQVKEHFNKILN